MSDYNKMDMDKEELEEDLQEEREQEEQESPNSSHANKAKSVLKEFLELSIYFFVVLVFSLLVITFVAQRTIVDGASMEPTLQNGDNLIVDKISYRFKEPQRYDIIVFPYRQERRTYYIKRIIGMPGETVRIGEDGTIYIDGEPLDEHYGKEIIDADKRGRANEDVVLGDDEYFVMGDNRNRSSDSRYFDVGNIKRKEIIGKTWVRVFPFKNFGKVKHQ